MRRHLAVALGLVAAAGGCSLFLDSGEFSSEDPSAGSGDSGTADASSSDVVVTSSDGSTANDGDANDGDANADAGDDFCTRSFTNPKLYVPFDLPVQALWSRITCEANASATIASNDGKPAASLSVATDSGVPAGAFRVCWAEKDVDIGHTYRFGVDVKVASPSLVDTVAVVRLELDMPNKPLVTYGINIGHGLQPAYVEHRFGHDDGGASFAGKAGIGAASLDWVSYRGEIVIVPGGKSRYTVCRDGQKVVDNEEIAEPLAVPTQGWFDIGIAYVDSKQTTPIELRFDNAFLEVVP